MPFFFPPSFPSVPIRSSYDDDDDELAAAVGMGTGPMFFYVRMYVCTTAQYCTLVPWYQLLTYLRVFIYLFMLLLVIFIISLS